MRTLMSALPSADLRPFVRAYAERRLSGGFDLFQPVLSSLEPVLEFDLESPPIAHYTNGNIESVGAISIVGAHTFQRVSLKFIGSVRSFAVFFQPFGIWQLFGISPSDLVNQAYPGVDVLGAGIKSLWNELAEAREFSRRVEIVEAALLRQAQSVAPISPTMSAALHAFRQRGAPRIDAIAERHHVSVRQLERRFCSEIGIGPKRFAKIARFQSALDAKIRVPATSWLTIAHAFGYHDQMHMVRDFEQFGGASPTTVFDSLGDGRPSALAEN